MESITTIEASIFIPTERAKPPRDTKFISTLVSFKRMNERIILIGISITAV